MSRKHEKFSYNYGFKTAPEQWNFYYNGNYIPLDNDIRNTLAVLCISGKTKEAKDELKRLLRKEEKELHNFVTYGVYAKGSSNFYYTKQLIAHDDNIDEKLYIYKELKRYIEKECNGYIKPFSRVSGYITPYGSEGVKKDNGVLVDMSRILTIRFPENPENRLFRA